MVSNPLYGWLVILCMAGRWVQNALVHSRYHLGLCPKLNSPPFEQVRLKRVGFGGSKPTPYQCFFCNKKRTAEPGGAFVV